MSAPYSNIETKAELACVYHLNGISSSLAGITIHAGVDGSELTLSCVVAAAKGAEEKIFGTGQYAVDMVIEVHTEANDNPAATHRQNVAYVRDQFANNWVGASLSAQVNDFTAVGVVLQKSSQTIDGNHWVTSIPMEIHCRPSD